MHTHANSVPYSAKMQIIIARHARKSGKNNTFAMSYNVMSTRDSIVVRSAMFVMPSCCHTRPPRQSAPLAPSHCPDTAQWSGVPAGLHCCAASLSQGTPRMR